MTNQQQDPAAPNEDRAFDADGHVNADLSPQEQFQALYDGARHGEALRVLADVVFKSNMSGTVNPDKGTAAKEGSR